MRGSSLVLFMCAAPAAAAALLVPTTSTSRARRNALAGGFACGIAAVTGPLAASAKLGDGCPECQKNKELETSPLIEELKRRTEANKERNAAIVKENLAFTGNVAEEEVKLVRYQGATDTIPVTRMMNKQQIQQLEGLGYQVNCPSWGGACDVTKTVAAAPPPPPPPPPPVVEESPPPSAVEESAAPAS